MLHGPQWEALGLPPESISRGIGHLGALVQAKGP